MNYLKYTLVLFCINYTFGQKITNSNKKNSVFIEFYQPFSNNFADFYNTNYDGFGFLIEGENNFTNKSSSFAYGIGYERISENNIVFRPRLGYSVINKTKINYSQETSGNPATYSQDYNFNQNHINLFIGIAKRINITKKINIDLGIELASIYYLEGKGNFSSYSIIIDSNNGDTFIQESNIQTKMGDIYSFGIGPYVKPEINILNDLSLSFELQLYYLRTISNDISTRRFVADDYFNNENTSHIENFTTVKNNFKLWDWSNISPLIRLSYHF